MAKRATTAVNLGMFSGPPSWMGEEGCVKRELSEPCLRAVRQQADRLPKDLSETRLVRNRRPRSRLDQMLRQGDALAAVAESAALQTVERWLRALRAKVPREELAPVIARLVHTECVEPEGTPLGAALRRLVPKPVTAAVMGWPFIDETLEVLELEEKLDPANLMNQRVGSLDEKVKLQLVCRGPVPVWEVPSRPSSSFSREKSVTTLLGREEQESLYLPRARSSPDPGLSPKGLQVTSLRATGRASFPPVGLPRPVCLASPLSERPREFAGPA